MINAMYSLPMSDTRKQVRELREANLSITMSEIAKRVGVSRQRVYQILHKDGFPTKRRVLKNQYECLVCGAASEHKFCSKECKINWKQIPVVCTRCGKLFLRNRNQLLNNYRRHNDALFCSKHCSGKWLSENYVLKDNHHLDGVTI
jgi:transcription elongation factor Elf1